MQLESLLEYGESSWLDWKRNFPPGLLERGPGGNWEQGKGELLKDLVAIANGEEGRDGYLVYGVHDHGTRREVIGISRRWDDADFQTWAANSFEPCPKFIYEEIEWKEGIVVAKFTINRVPEYPHVVLRDVDDILRRGQVWFRRGSQNTIAGRRELEQMFRAPDPVSLERHDKGLGKEITDHYLAQGKVPRWRRYSERHQLLAQGWQLGYAPETRRPVVAGRFRGEPDLILMIKPGESRALS